LHRENDFLKSQLTQSQKTFQSEQQLIKIQREELNQKEKELTRINLDLEKRLAEETENRRKVVSQKKSSEVRLGGIAETLAPFLDQFEFDPENCTFLGKPIDYISFADDEITFIEVKSGNSQLNSKQRHIRDQVKAKLINWKEIRIK
jgi:predicted Holliday junction resolvase-like endonuclease